jgi:hypothetical protein
MTVVVVTVVEEGSAREVEAWAVASSSHSPCTPGRRPMVTAALMSGRTAQPLPPGTQPLGRRYTPSAQAAP